MEACGVPIAVYLIYRERFVEFALKWSLSIISMQVYSSTANCMIGFVRVHYHMKS